MGKPSLYEKHIKESRFLSASTDRVFNYIDDHSHFYAHVIKLARILGGQLDLKMDNSQGRMVGSHIHLAGKFLGKSVSLDEVVRRREAPNAKSWETTGTPNFLVVGPYRFNVAVKPENQGSRLSISIDYSLPEKSGFLQKQFSNFYMKVCAKEMINGTRSYFAKQEI